MTKNTSNNILQSEVDKLFPFSFSLSNEMRIIRIGPSLSKIIPAENKTKQHFTEIFEISKPHVHGEIDFNSLEKLSGNLIIIRIKNLDKVVLKGQLEFRKEQHELIFFGTLWIDHYSKMMEIGLTYTDFPAYDPIFDIQQMKAVLENEKEDIHKLKSELNIINHSADLFLTLLPSGVIKKVSLSSVSMLGYETHELIGENIQSIFFDEKIELKKLFVEIIENEKPTEFTTHLYTKKHKKIGVGISFTPVKQEINNLTRA